MKKIIIATVLLIVSVSFSQKKKTIPPPPTKIKPVVTKTDEEKIKKANPVYKIISKKVLLAFENDVADAVILPENKFAEALSIEFHDGSYSEITGTIVEKFTVDTLRNSIESGSIKKALSYREKRTWGTIIINKNILTFIEDRTSEKRKYNVVLDKTKEEILYLESVDKKKKYYPEDWRNSAPAPSMGN